MKLQPWYSRWRVRYCELLLPQTHVHDNQFGWHHRSHSIEAANASRTLIAHAFNSPSVVIEMHADTGVRTGLPIKGNIAELCVDRYAMSGKIVMSRADPQTNYHPYAFPRNVWICDWCVRAFFSNVSLAMHVIVYHYFDQQWNCLWHTAVCTDHY